MALASACDYTFAMLSDPPAAMEVALGPNGIVGGMLRRWRCQYRHTSYDIIHAFYYGHVRTTVPAAQCVAALWNIQILWEIPQVAVMKYGLHVHHMTAVM